MNTKLPPRSTQVVVSEEYLSGKTIDGDPYVSGPPGHNFPPTTAVTQGFQSSRARAHEARDSAFLDFSGQLQSSAVESYCATA